MKIEGRELMVPVKGAAWAALFAFMLGSMAHVMGLMAFVLGVWLINLLTAFVFAEAIPKGGSAGLNLWLGFVMGLTVVLAAACHNLAVLASKNYRDAVEEIRNEWRLRRGTGIASEAKE